VCSYCRREENLPADVAEQNRHLRLRLLQLQRARDTVEAPVRTLQALQGSYGYGLFFMAAIAAWQGVMFVSQLRPGPTGVAFGQAILAVWPLGLAGGMLAGWLGMTRTFARKLRPLLRARAPIAHGLAARCRSCGAQLPPVRAPQVICTYCSATNLLDAALTANASTLLAAEAEEHRRRAGGWTHDPAVYKAPARAFYVYGGVTAAVLATVAAALVVRFR
jgi:hypothetical protein